MGKIIILEGPDGTGKTTLARELEKSYLFKYVHVGPPKPGEDVLHTYADILYKANLDQNHGTVIDRLHLGEATYGKLLRSNDRLGDEGLTLLLRMINAYGVHTVVCLPPYEVAAANWFKNQKNELIKDKETYKKIYDAYLGTTTLRHFGRPSTYDYTRMPLELSSKLITSSLTTQPRLPTGVIGYADPTFLIVGEIANHEELDVPFMSLTGSSSFLYHCLKEAGYYEEEMAFVNAYFLDRTSVDLRAVWERLKRPVPILLGRLAQKAFTPGVNVAQVTMLPHPAYWKRFNSSKRSEYVEMLAKVRRNAHAAND